MRVIGHPNIDAGSNVLLVFEDPPGVVLDLQGPGIRVVHEFDSIATVVATPEGEGLLSARGYRIERDDSVKVVGGASYSYDYTRGPASIPLALQMEWRGWNAMYPFIIKSLGPVPPSYLSDLRGIGVNITESSFLGSCAFLVEMRASVIPRVMELPYVAWVEPFHYVYRLYSDVLQWVADPRNCCLQLVPLGVTARPGVPGARLRSDLLSVGAIIRGSYDSSSGSFVDVWATGPSAYAIGRLDSVRYVVTSWPVATGPGDP